MAQPYSTGPAHIFIGVGPGGAPIYLGTCEGAPRIEHRAALEPVMNDISGPRVPFDKMWVGEEAMVSVDMTRWNEPVRALALSRWQRGGVIPRGTENTFARGTLLITEGMAFGLWVLFPNSIFNPAMATLPNGYRYPAAWVETPESLEPGVRPYKTRMVFSALGVYTPAVGGFLLYDGNMAGLPPTN